VRRAPEGSSDYEEAQNPAVDDELEAPYDPDTMFDDGSKIIF
jgi:hypothetical protein